MRPRPVAANRNEGPAGYDAYVLVQDDRPDAVDVALWWRGFRAGAWSVALVLAGAAALLLGLVP